jgi:hypothetical protein
MSWGSLLAYTCKDRRKQSNASDKADGVPAEIKIFKCLDCNCEVGDFLIVN